MSSDRGPYYIWVKSLGLNWLGYVSLVSELAPLLGIVVLSVGGLTKSYVTIYTGLAILGVGIAAFFIYTFFFFHSIRCPKCGYNPTRKKDGSRRKNFRATETSVSKLVACPKCHEEGAISR
jgi:hypothetical protein